MALKAQRYDEATSTYEKILETAYTVDAWTGLAICKLFQIADGRSMEEVLYCIEKARNVEGANNASIDLKLIEYTQIVIIQCAAYAIAAINNAIEAEKNAKKAALLSIASVAVAGMSNSTGVKILAGTAAAASAGVAIGQFGKMTSSKEIGQYAISLLNNIYTSIHGSLIESNKIEQATVLEQTTFKLCEDISEALDPSIKERRLAEEQHEKLVAEQEQKLQSLKSQLSDENLISLVSSFADIGLLDQLDFNEVKDDDVIKAIGNDKVLFSLRVFHVTGNPNHYFCENGILNNHNKYFYYKDIQSLEKTFFGGLKDKSSGYKIDLNSQGWHSLIIDFVNYRREESSLQIEEAQEASQNSESKNTPDATSFEQIPFLPFTGEYKDVVEANCKEEDVFTDVVLDATKAVIVFGEKGVVWYFKALGNVRLKYYLYDSIVDLQKNWLGTLQDKKSGFKISLTKPDNWSDIIIEYIKSKKTK